MVRPLLLLGLALCTSAGCATTLPTNDVDRNAAVTVEDFAAWVAGHELDPVVDTFEKTSQLGFYTLSYRYHAKGDHAEFILNSEAILTPKEAEAKSAYRSFVIGARVARGELVEVTPTLDWPDDVAVFKSVVDGRQVGNVYVARRGTVAVMVAVGGLHDETSTYFEQTLEPALWALTRYDPVRASGRAVAGLP